MTIFMSRGDGAPAGAELPPVTLPRPRGPISSWLLHRLQRPVHDLGPMPGLTDDLLLGEDGPLALYLCYELHYQGLPDVDESWEWAPSLLAVRARLEHAVEQRLIDLVGHPPMGLRRDEVLSALTALAADESGPSLSEEAARRATLEQVRELLVHRSPYQLKEADPHTWAIPRLSGRAKAALVHIQTSEYGDGRPEALHAALFADTMAELGLDARYGAHLDAVPGISLSTCNLISMFGLHRRWRGALIGHLALFEMCSVTPMGRYQQCLERLGFGERATRFYAEHVEADARHEVVALHDMVAALAEDEPFLRGEIVFGARCLQAVEGLFARHVLEAWEAGTTSLRQPL